MDKFEEKERMKIRLIKNTWYDCLIYYIPEPIRKSVKVISHFKTNSPKQTVYGKGKKLNKSKTQNQSEEYYSLDTFKNWFFRILFKYFISIYLFLQYICFYILPQYTCFCFISLYIDETILKNFWKQKYYI